jgi:hypothetical protein
VARWAGHCVAPSASGRGPTFMGSSHVRGQNWPSSHPKVTLALSESASVLDMTEPQQSVTVMPRAREARSAVGDVVNGRRWNGSAWESAGAEGVASVLAARQHLEAAPVVMNPRR